MPWVDLVQFDTSAYSRSSHTWGKKAGDDLAAEQVFENFKPHIQISNQTPRAPLALPVGQLKVGLIVL
jgi:hypothetical protein